MKRLSPRQERFCLEYIVDLNAAQAAIRAGYAPKFAKTNTTKLLLNTNIQKRISGLKAEREESTKISSENVVKELAACAFFDPVGIYDGNGNILPFEKWPAICRRMIRSHDAVTTENGVQLSKIRWNDKGKYMELLCRHLGLLRDKVEVSTDEVSLRSILSGIHDARRAKDGRG